MSRTISLVTICVVLAGGFRVAEARTPNDTFYAQQWYLRQISAEQAWDKTVGSESVVVAVIDTGVDIDHEDLRLNIWTNPGEIPGNNLDDDRNGLVDDVHGWNFYRKTNDVRPRNGGTDAGFLHGTFVASLIGARGDNGLGLTGVAWKVKIMPLVALDESGAGSTKDVAAAVRYAAEHGAHIINLSLEGYTRSPELEEALALARSRGILTIAAAGNADVQGGYDLDLLRVYPACLSHDASFGVVGVGGTDTLDQKTRYGNYGSCLNLSAPAYNLFGARPIYYNTTTTQFTAGYEGGLSGTSLAAPLVAGVAALLKSLRPDWGAAEIRERLIVSAIPIDDLQAPDIRGKLGRGRLNAAQALEGVMSLATTTTTAPLPIELLATLSGQPTRVIIRQATSTRELRPFGAKDLRGARAAFVQLDADARPEIVVVPGSGRIGEWAAFNLDGTERTRGQLSADLRQVGRRGGGLLLAAVPSGFVVAEADGGRAWGVDGSATTTVFHPYGARYRHGLDLLPVPGGAAFAPRQGGGHLMARDRNGRLSASVFPFGDQARGHWSLGMLPATALGPARLVFQGPTGAQVVPLDGIGVTAWQPITLSPLEAGTIITSAGRSSDIPAARLFDTWFLPGQNT